jgi:hypothetical protein
MRKAMAIIVPFGPIPEPVAGDVPEKGVDAPTTAEHEGEKAFLRPARK